MQVRNIMTTNPAYCMPNTNAAAAAELLWVNDCGALPVVDEAGMVTGMITDRDLLIALGTRDALASQTYVRDVMPAKLTVCYPEMDVLNALAIMAAEQVRRVPVVSDTGKLLGVLSICDAIRHAEHGGLEISYHEVMETLKSISAPATESIEIAAVDENKCAVARA